MPEIRNFIGYGNHPPQFKWEKNAKLAVQFVLNYEEGGENTVFNGDEHSEIFLSEIIGAKPVIGDRNIVRDIFDPCDTTALSTFFTTPQAEHNPPSCWNTEHRFGHIQNH